MEKESHLLVYLHDQETGVFCGTYRAQLCPVTKSEYIYNPEHATEIPPPKCKENEYAVWVVNNWIKKTKEPEPIIEPHKESPEVSARHMRDMLLRNADIDINKLEDTGRDARHLRVYRQQLREVPQLDGFPDNIDWPVIQCTNLTE